MRGPAWESREAAPWSMRRTRCQLPGRSIASRICRPLSMSSAGPRIGERLGGIGRVSNALCSGCRKIHRWAPPPMVLMTQPNVVTYPRSSWMRPCHTSALVVWTRRTTSRCVTCRRPFAARPRTAARYGLGGHRLRPTQESDGGPRPRTGWYFHRCGSSVSEYRASIALPEQPSTGQGSFQRYRAPSWRSIAEGML